MTEKVTTEVTINLDQEATDQEAASRSPRVKLLVGNIPFALTYEEVVRALSAAAQILELRMPVDPLSTKNKGWALCWVAEREVEALLRATIPAAGRILRVQRAR